MSTILLVIHILLAIGLVGVILIQRNEGGLGGLGGGGGGGGGMMSGRSAANLLTRSTAIIATLFIVNSVALAIVAGTERSSILIDDPVTPPAVVTPTGDVGADSGADNPEPAPAE
ncbi:MAG: preprotein translocase subunit SecG [Alphaproteobacteria bacterium]